VDWCAGTIAPSQSQPGSTTIVLLEPDYERARTEMVRSQVEARGIHSPLVLAALRHVPRERYVSAEFAGQAYEDRPLPIEDEQTISQPYIVAYMLEALGLRGGERVLEVGTGSGYATALLAEIGSRVCTIERHAGLARSARARLEREGLCNVELRHGDGTLGWPEAAPFDAILVSAGGPHVPEALKRQLAPGGRLVMPVGSQRRVQHLVRVTRTGPESFEEQRLTDVHFVPLVGAEGWEPVDAGRGA
jgi:protein-L-isoaspartate(D-aspartate) O-methyltransferase